jgi:SAM-dependent methyltransferase
MKMDFDPSIYTSSAYSTWLKHANERDVLEDTLRKRFNNWCPGREISILELGCGLGSAAQRVMNILEERGINYDYTGVDPYLNQLERFRESLPDDKKVKLVRGTFDDFNAERRYDLALVVHSLYYVDNLEDSLNKVHQLADKALIIHHGKEGINTIHEKFPHYVTEGPHIISTHEDVALALDGLNIGYDVSVYSTNVNVRPCKDPQNYEGRKMIKFFLESTEISDKIIEEVSGFFCTMPDTMNHDMAVILTSPCP